MARGKSITTLEIEFIRGLVDRGFGWAQIGRRLKLNRQTVQRVAKRHGIELLTGQGDAEN